MVGGIEQSADSQFSNTKFGLGRVAGSENSVLIRHAARVCVALGLDARCWIGAGKPIGVKRRIFQVRVKVVDDQVIGMRLGSRIQWRTRCQRSKTASLALRIKTRVGSQFFAASWVIRRGRSGDGRDRRCAYGCSLIGGG